MLWYSNNFKGSILIQQCIATYFNSIFLVIWSSIASKFSNIQKDVLNLMHEVLSASMNAQSLRTELMNFISILSCLVYHASVQRPKSSRWNYRIVHYMSQRLKRRRGGICDYAEHASKVIPQNVTFPTTFQGGVERWHGTECSARASSISLHKYIPEKRSRVTLPSWTRLQVYKLQWKACY